jgi:hypothetical protein
MKQESKIKTAVNTISKTQNKTEMKKTETKKVPTKKVEPKVKEPKVKKPKRVFVVRLSEDGVTDYGFRNVKALFNYLASLKTKKYIPVTIFEKIPYTYEALVTKCKDYDRFNIDCENNFFLEIARITLTSKF